MAELPFRQVHLDFHTSPLIPDVGADFDAAEFVATLEAAHVDSITVFAKCHHGMSYYPTDVGVVHPTLNRDLLGEMIDACQVAGIRTPVYISVVWDEHMAHEHPEWLQVPPSGLAGVTARFSAGWKWLCMNSPYIDYVAAQTEEVVQRYRADGIFFDIIMMVPPGCVCKYCLDGMVAAGLDPLNEEHLRRYSNDVAHRAMDKLSRAVRRHEPGLRIFYNSRLRLARSTESGWRAEMPYMTHVEIESLPSGQWGYLHYPLYARYVQTLGTEYLGMTARFHKSWADFGGMKNEAALEYEVFAMLATGAKCSIGDQLHPRGRLEQPAYDLIGRVYASVEAKEPWCTGVEPVKEVGVLITVEGWDRAADLTPEEGATRMLLESQWQHQLVDAEADLGQYPLLVLPDRMPVSTALAERLQAYVAGGGALIVSGGSGLRGGDGSLEDVLGVTYAGAPDYTTHYIQPTADLGLPDMPHVMYEQATLARPRDGVEVLASIVAPYFERTWDHFSSHRQTPPAQATEWPAVTQKGRVIYIAAPIFSAYRRHGNLVYRQLVEACLNRLLPHKALRAALPSSGQVTLFRRGADLVAHLLYYVPERRTPDTDIIEDVVALPDVRAWVYTGEHPKQVYMVPERRNLAWNCKNGLTSFTIPELRGHQMVVIET